MTHAAPAPDRTSRRPVPDLLVDLLRASLLAVEHEGDQPLGQLTDEELATIDGSRSQPDERLVELPRVDRLEGAAREAALSAARAGLLARGLVRPEALGLGVQEPLAMAQLRGVLGLLVWLRTSPDGLTWVTSETRSTVRHRYLYGVAGVAVLEEDIGDDGLHRFTLRSHAGAVVGLVDLVDPDARAAADGDPLVHDGHRPPPGWHEVEAAVAAAQRVTRIEAVVSDDPSRQVALSLVAGPSGVLVVGTAWPPSSGTHATRTAARPASPETLRELLLAVLGTADPGHRAPDGPTPAGPEPDGPAPGVTAARGAPPAASGRSRAD